MKNFISKMANWATQSAVREYQVNANGKLTVVERLASLLETGQYADIAIKVGTGQDAKTFKAHRILLATASEHLNSLVESCPDQGDAVTINVTDIDPESFQHVLKYIYTDDVRVSSINDAINLIKYSEKWGLESLGVETIKFMKQFLDEYEPTSEDMKNDLCELIIWAEEGNYEKLKNRCWDVLIKYVNVVVPCESFLNMKEDTVRKLLTHEDFRYKNQILLFEAIRDWGMNQVLKNNLKENQLQSVISGLLKHIDFEGIQDNDFLATIMPSACVGKAELISYFMSRGLDIPRDLALNNNERIPTVKQNGAMSDFEKASRFKKGYKISDQEIYQEHELRFRVDKDLVLLGVGFGFLFSNTDMGITVHCQGPWETRQWTDIAQTYCRISYETMKTADIRLMFREPVAIQANQSYKILVRIGRMSAGASEVDLWGGGEGPPSVKTKDAEFYFLNKATDPKKKVEDKDIDKKPSMITELIYQHEGFSPSNEEEVITGVKTTIRKPHLNSLTPLSIPSPPIIADPPTFARQTSIPQAKSPVPNPPSSPKPWSPTIQSKPFARVESPVRTIPTPFTPPPAAPQSPVPFVAAKKTPTTTAKSSPNISSPSSPLLTTKKTLTKLPSFDEAKKKSFLTNIKDPEPEPSWVKRKKSVPSVEEDKSVLNPFRKSRPTDEESADKVSLPWQRKSSLKQQETVPSFYLKSRPLSSTTTSTLNKSMSATDSKLPWSIPRKSETSSYISKYSPRETETSPYTSKYTPRETETLSYTSKYTPRDTETSSYKSKYSPRDTGSSYTSKYSPRDTESSYASKYSPRESSISRNRESSVSRTRESSVYTPRNYSSLYSKKDNLSLGSANTSNYCYKPYSSSNLQNSTKSASSPYSSTLGSSSTSNYSSYKPMSARSNDTGSSFSSTLDKSKNTPLSNRSNDVGSSYSSNYDTSKNTSASSLTPFGKSRTSAYEPMSSKYTSNYSPSSSTTSRFDSSIKTPSSSYTTQSRQSVSRFDSGDASGPNKTEDSTKSKYSYLNNASSYSKPSYEPAKGLGKTLYSSNPSPRLSNREDISSSSSYSSYKPRGFGESKANKSEPYSMANPYGSRVAAFASKYSTQPSSYSRR